MAAPGIIPNSSVPSPIPDGLLEACEAALGQAGLLVKVTRAPDGLHVSDVPTVIATISSYVGGAAQLAYHKAQKQAALDTFFNANFDFLQIVHGGTSSNVSVGSFMSLLAGALNNYRSLRSSIANAANVAAVNAINVNSGWPANP